MPSTSFDELVHNFGATSDFVVRAGAGAGKTTELVQRVLAIAYGFHKQHGRFPKLVVTTFTRKATQELRERLLHKALEMQEPLLIDFVQRGSLLHISTIHGVLGLFLSRQGSGFGLSPQFTMIDKDKEFVQIKKILRTLLENPVEARWIQALLEECSLKTLIQLLQNYFHLRVQVSGPIPFATTQDLLQAQATEDAEWLAQAGDLASYIERNEPGEKWQAYLGVLRNVMQALQKDPTQAAQHYKKFTEDKPKATFKAGTDKDVSQLRKDVQELAEDYATTWWRSPDAHQAHQRVSEDFGNLAEAVFGLLLQQKIDSAKLTMSDLESLSLWFLQADPEAGKNFAKDWDYWLIDEYQDTSPVQVALLAQLMDQSKAFIVGDPQQSIYLFRGARSEVFARKESSMVAKGGQALSKMVNYRSRPELLRFFNQFFEQLQTPAGEKKQFRAMIESAVADKPKHKDWPIAYYYQCIDEKNLNHEHEAVVDHCFRLLDQGVAPEQICVLSRRNAELEKIATLAEGRGLPVQVHASAKFYARREVIDALSLLRFLANPSDNLNFLQLLRSPWFRIEDQQILNFCSQHSASYWQVAKEQQRTKPVSMIAELLAILQLSSELGLSRAFELGLQRSGLVDMSPHLDPSGRREANLWKLILSLRFEEKLPGFSYLEFAGRAESAMVSVEESGDADATPVVEPARINFMTVHASKGLQFEHVLLPSMGNFRPRIHNQFFLHNEEEQKIGFSLNDPAEGKLQASAWGRRWLEQVKQREIAEYDRVLYVALTRAKISVALFWSKLEKGSWAERMFKPSADDVAQGLVRFTDWRAPEEPRVLAASQTQTQAILQPLQTSAAVNVSNISVTDLLQQTETKRSSKALQFPADKEYAAAAVDKALNGVRVHRLFEDLHFHSPEVLAEVKDPALNFVREWENGLLLEWIHEGHVEWGFTLDWHGRWIQGQIDLWYLDKNNVLWVVDYKTGSMQHSEKAFTQLEIYAWALRRMQKANPVQTNLVVVYPYEQQILKRPAVSVKDFETKLTALLSADKQSHA